MRVTGGEVRGFYLQSPVTNGVRPTTDRVRSALFSILASWGIEEARVIDLFAGTGSLGIEALSRGAAHCDFVEADRNQVGVITANLRTTKLDKRGTVIHGYAERVLKTLVPPYDLMLMDPPYSQPFPTTTVQMIADLELVSSEDGIVVVGHSSRTPVPDKCGALTLTQDRRYGDASLSFYAMEGSKR